MENEEKILSALSAIQDEIKNLQSDVSLIKRNIGFEIFKRSSKDFKILPFNFLRNAEPSQVADLLEDEPPKIIALVLNNLEIDFAACVVQKLSPDIHAEIFKEIATLEIISPKIIKEVEEKLITKISNPKEEQYSVTEGGISSVVEILNRVNRTTEKSIINDLEKIAPEVAEEIRKLMFVFEDIVMLDDRSLQMVLREVNSRDLLLALKATSPEVAEKIYSNMSKRAAADLKKEIEFMGPIKIRDVEEAQLKIVNVIRVLESKGDIVISHGLSDEMIV